MTTSDVKDENEPGAERAGWPGNVPAPADRDTDRLLQTQLDYVGSRLVHRNAGSHQESRLVHQHGDSIADKQYCLRSYLVTVSPTGAPYLRRVRMRAFALLTF
jgi:hypothetical protein